MLPFPTTLSIRTVRQTGAISPHHRGIDVWGGYNPESEAGARYANRRPRLTDLKPAGGLISLDGTLYWYAERKSDGRVDCHLLTSTDYGRNWTDHGRFFQEDGKLGFTAVIQFGKNYSDAPAYLGDYLYLFDGGTKAESHSHYLRKDMLLARILHAEPVRRCSLPTENSP